MKCRLTIVIEPPDVGDDPLAPYFIEALLTYVRGVETGAFGSNASETINTITRCKLSATHKKIE